jgi:Xaa-Pro aminopeptidase
MLTPEGCIARRERLWAALPEACDAIVLGDPQSLIYVANYADSPFVFRSVDASALLVLTPGRAVLVADRNVKTYLDRAHVDEVVAPVWYDGKHTAPHRKTFLVATALDVLGKVAGARWGIESGDVPAGVVEGLGGSQTGLTWVDVSNVIRTLRRAKDPDELDLIRRSVAAGEAGHTAALNGLRPGMTELEAYLLVAQAATMEAGEQVPIYGDFVSGPRCETERGGPPSDRVIQPRELFLLDYSVVVHGYRADFTNTFAVGGAPTQAQRDLFAACLEAMQAGEDSLRPGTAGRDVDRAVKAALAARGLEHAFPSHSGHGLGLSHPEPPYFVADSVDTLAVGDVVALEPGLYIPGVGGMRFEHNYLITPTGFERLTKHRLTLEP